LIERSNPACRDPLGDYPLTAAIRHAQWGVARLLLECDERVHQCVNMRTKDNYTPLLLCLLRSASGVDIPCLSPRGRKLQRTNSLALLKLQDRDPHADSEALRCIRLLLQVYSCVIVHILSSFNFKSEAEAEAEAEAEIVD